MSEDLGIRLDSPLSCRQELERVANGIASLTVDHTKLLEEQAEIEDQWEIAEAAYYQQARPEKGETAGQIKARVLMLVEGNPTTATLRSRVRKVRSDLEANERRLKSLEKRLMAAMSALKDHDNEARSAGFIGGQGI